MSGDTLGWKLIGLAVSIITMAAPAYVAYDVWGKGTIPEKKVELLQIPAIDPMLALKSLPADVGFSFFLGKKNLDNLQIAQSFISNTGTTPILPSDYAQPLTVSVEKPWRMIAVRSSTDASTAAAFHWKYVDDNTFSADPALLNPADKITTYVYLTKDQGAQKTAGTSPDVPKLSWKARIVNLRSITEPVSIMEQWQKKQWGIVVELTGWGVPFVLFAAFLFQMLYLHLMKEVGFLKIFNIFEIGIVAITGVVSFAVAECMATYIFGTIQTTLLGRVDNWLNTPPIIFHVVTLILLHWQSKRKRRIEKIVA